MDTSEKLDRYRRQTSFAGVGEEGQERIAKSRAVVCGCGALGTVHATQLVRAGVGSVRIIDRDFVEITNLQRQFLFDEEDVRSGLPKAEAAARKLRRVNSQIEIEPVVAHLDPGNIRALLGDAQVILDGTDNFETRFLINDFSSSAGIPWIFGGCIGAEGQCMTIVPGRTACLRCLIEQAPEAGTTPTCETAGILAPASAAVASLQVAEALKILAGKLDRVRDTMLVLDLWDNTVRSLRLDGLRESKNCPVCDRKEYDWLDQKVSTLVTTLCGRNSVQVVPPTRQSIDWEELSGRWSVIGTVTSNPFLVRLEVDGYELSVFRDGRAIIKGTSEPDVARTVYAKYMGG